MVLFVLLLQALNALPVGSVRDFDVVTNPLATVETFSATLRASRTVRPGLSLSFWVEDTVWNSNQLNGLNLSTVSDRQFIVDEFADWMTMVLIPKLEGSYFNITEVNNSPSPGLNILFLDIEDGFKQNGSLIGASFNSNDQNLESGLNGMNLIYIDVNPGTLGYPLFEGLSKKNTYIEVVRSLSRLIQFQKDPTEEEWIREGIAQMMIYRLLNQEVFPNSQARIINAPIQGIPEVQDYVADISSMRPQYDLNPVNTDRLSVFTNPRDPRDNAEGKEYRGFHYLFFSYIFHRLGGGFQTRVTDGDRFFSDLMIQSKDGLEGFNKVLGLYNMPRFEEIYIDFLFSVILKTTESRYSNPAINLKNFQFSNYDLIDRIPTSLISRLPSFGVDIKRVLNDTAADQHDINLLIPAGLSQSRIYLIRNQASGELYVEKQFESNDLRGLILPGVEKRVLIVNLDDQTKDFVTQMTRNELSTTIPTALEPNSSKDFGESTGAIVISDELASAVYDSGVSGTVNISLSGKGVFSLPFTNASTHILRLSLPDNIVTTAVDMDIFNEIQFSVNSLVPVTKDRILILKPSSTAVVLFINKNILPVTVALTYDLINSNLYAVLTSESTLSAGSESLSEEELQRITGGGAGGCFVATASFGSYNHPFVRLLCGFRDEYLLTNALGREFVQWYYRVSPYWAAQISGSKILQALVQFLLLPLIFMVAILMSPSIALVLLVIMGVLRSYREHKC